SALLSSRQELRLRQSYAEREADGSLEMPRVSIAFSVGDGAAMREPLETSRYPPADGSFFSASLFNPCRFESTTNCCEYGASECSAEWSVALERVGGDPFPPMELSWELGLTARVSTCPLQDT